MYIYLYNLLLPKCGWNSSLFGVISVCTPDKNALSLKTFTSSFFALLSTQHTKVRCSEALRPWPANQAMAVATDVIATFFFSSVHNKTCRSIFQLFLLFFFTPPKPEP